MKRHKLLLLLIAMVFFWGCSENQRMETAVDEPPVESDETSFRTILMKSQWVSTWNFIRYWNINMILSPA